MARALTFSRFFPAYHLRKGEPTNFIEKIYAGMADTINGFEIPNDANEFWDFHEYYNFMLPKYHTIRAGHRWKVGDKFSPRVWSGKPYASKMVTIYPDIEVKKVWDFKLEVDGDHYCILIDGKPYVEFNSAFTTNTGQLDFLAKNDGLNALDMLYWFDIHPKKKGKEFAGQIICWNESQITSSKILEIIKVNPLFGHTTGRQAKTIWMSFVKGISF